MKGRPNREAGQPFVKYHLAKGDTSMPSIQQNTPEVEDYQVDLNTFLTSGNNDPLLARITGQPSIESLHDGDWVMLDQGKKPIDGDVVICRDEDGGFRACFYETDLETVGVITFVISQPRADEWPEFIYDSSEVA